MFKPRHLPGFFIFADMNLFYLPHIKKGTNVLSKEESQHCIKVLRHKPGDVINIVDGKGGWFTAEIINDDPKACSVNVISEKQESHIKKGHLHIAIAPTKNINRYEWFLEKATEIGVDEITPLICAHSERTKVKPERLEKILLSAMKQSLKATLPKLNEQQKFSKFIKSGVFIDYKRYIAFADEENIHLKETVFAEKTLILIGPEGDFSNEEIIWAKDNGFVPVSLGNTRLRTETAGVVACTILNLNRE